MPSIARMSSDGDIEIPNEIRNRLNLKEGAKFVVEGYKDAIVLKILRGPALEQYKTPIQMEHIKTRPAMLKRKDVAAALARRRSGE
jgi:AbrB family looped-hinge helix DNA binding protein